MDKLVEKLTGRRQPETSSAPIESILFGSRTNLTDTLAGMKQARLRVGLWPIQSQSAAEAAMGLAALLGFLLERWPAIRVYRLFARLEGEPDNYHWKMQDSQFGVDDWELENLDENIAIWGTLETLNGTYSLTLDVENDLTEEDVKEFHYGAPSLAALTTEMLKASEDIAEYLNSDAANPVSPVYLVGEADENALRDLLKEAFLWELHLLLRLWGKPWTEAEFETQLESLKQAGGKVKHDLGAWFVSHSLGRALSPIYAPINDLALAKVRDAAAAFEDDSIAAILLGLGAFGAGDLVQAYDLLESGVETHPENALTWYVLAELYRQANDLPSSIETLQRAIEADAASVNLYMRYAELLLLVSNNNLPFRVGTQRNSPSGRTFQERLALIDDEQPGDGLIHEAAAAYQEALEIEPDNLEALYQYTLYLVNQDEENELWKQFAKLVELDKDGESVRGVVDVFYNIEDISRGIDILKRMAGQEPNRADVRVNLANAYLTDEDGGAARTELEKARALAKNDAAMQAEIERGLLAADDPEFEARLGEITDLVNAGQELSGEDVEYLEDTLEEAPTFTTAYTLLAAAYLKWNETNDALEVLLDAQKHVPDDPEIILLLARVLWNSDQTDLAFDYLNKGLSSNHNHAGLLALTGQYLFEDGQEAAAKEFLARAEALSPYDPIFRQARAHVARSLSDIPDEEE